MNWIKKIFYMLICCITCSSAAQSIIVDDSKTAIDLVNILTNNESCVDVSGKKVKGDTFSGSKNSYGSFDKNGSSFPFSEGVLLSTWSSTFSEGRFIREPDNSPKSGSSSWAGDADLDVALGINSINATVLEFDFIPVTNFISFDYIFASNEYQDVYPCYYSDGFAFLIKENGSSGSYTNIAVLPNTATSVSSINVHPIIPNFTRTDGTTIAGCPAANEQYFGQSNTASTNSSPINYAGQTTVLTAQTIVIAGKSYHIKLVLADDQLVDYDSAVFLQAGSFVSEIDLGQDKLIDTNNPVCFGETITLSSSLNGRHKWTRTDSSGTTTTLAEIGSSLTVQKEGVYQAEVPVAANCTVSGEIKIEYGPKIILTNTSLIKCNDSEDPFFDLTKAEATIRNKDASLTTFDYYETQTGTILSDPIENPKSFVKTAPTDQTVFVKATSETYGCTEAAEINLQTIPGYELATTPSTSPIINDFSGNDNSVQLIPPTTNDTYEFSLDGKNFQLSPFFTNLAAGNYTAFIRDSDTCAYLTYPISILDYPRFFTPNGDGYNDFWKLKTLAHYPYQL
jgi:hypothetical protein